MVINNEIKCVYLLDKFLEISEFGMYSEGIVEMVTREVTKNHIEKQPKQYQKIRKMEYHIQR